MSPYKSPNKFNKMRTEPYKNRNWEKIEFQVLQEPDKGIKYYKGIYKKNTTH